MEWTRNKYNDYYNSYMPWVEDKYLQWFGENKTSYTTKETLKTDVTGDKNVNSIQNGIAEGVGGQFSKGGALNSVGEAVSSEGFNRYEHAAPEADKQGKGWTDSARDGASSVGGAVSGVGSSVGGLLGGGQKDEGKEKKDAK